MTNNAQFIAPISMECDAPFLTIRGELPRGLNGTLYRNGPNPMFAADGAHWFTGDGMLHAFTLDCGRASYRNRWVRTARWQAEHDAGRKLFDAFGRDAKGSKTALASDQGTANTNVIWHAGRLLALEEAHLPIEVDPFNLSTIGPVDFGGAINGPFTAHPKIDPFTGELIFFGYGTTGPLSTGMTYGVINAGGVVTRFDHFEAPYSSMVHDFAVTAGHVLFPIQPLVGSMVRAQKGEPPFAWEPERGTRIGVMPRKGSVNDIRWFQGESGYVFHVMNAWEEIDGQRIVAEVMRYAEPPFFPRADGKPSDARYHKARLFRWTFNLSDSSDQYHEQCLDDLAGEFPRIDERRAGLNHRHGWMTCERAGSISGGHEGLAHRDTVSGQRSIYMLPPGDKFSEPVFVPYAADAPEGDGWLLAIVFRAKEGRSDFAVFNATTIADGPIATVELSHRIPGGFHGNWRESLD